MSPVKNVSPREALRRLKEGNQQYLRAERPSGNISPKVRKETAAHGQKPFAVVIACSDSRVIPEDIFSCGIGDLFVIRTAGNTIDRPQLASIEYALHHLGTRLILVLGHTRCGAVGAALQPEEGGIFVPFLLEEIRRGIGGETDERAASIRNIQCSVRRIEADLKIPKRGGENSPEAAGALYDVDTGEVIFFSDDLSNATESETDDAL